MVLTEISVIYKLSKSYSKKGRFIEEIGTYNPNTDPSEFKIDEEKAKKWLANGAQPTEMVSKLLKIAKITE